MKERGMLFSKPMVLALLDGSKTQTRRLCKLPDNAQEVQYWAPPSGKSQPGWADPGVNYWTPDPNGETSSNHLDTSPYGQPGDRLWVREAWRAHVSHDHVPPRDIPVGAVLLFEADADKHKFPWAGKYRPPMFMPRWASRIDLEITGVRVERLQDITESDAIAEGIQPIIESDGPNYFTAHIDGWNLNSSTALGAYQMLWEWINGAGSWDKNPWVWVIEFRRI
jgi:hypothetical protein